MFRICFLLITLFASAFASTSAFAETEQKNLSLPFANVIDQHVSDKANTLEDLLTFPLASKTNKPLSPTSQNHSKSIEFAQPTRSNLLSKNQQQSPDYVLAYELLTEKLDLFANLKSTLALSSIPWFMNYSKSSSRISGWKESNSLYASRITYHLI